MMMRWIPALFSLFLLSPASHAEQSCAAALDVTVRKLHSDKQLDLCEMTRNRTTLVVNTASQCGYTGQFKGLEALYKAYKEDGLVIVGFPSNDFNQELGSESAVADICYINYGVTFPMAATSSVKGDQANAVFQVLNAATQAPGWNFNKYLVSANGDVITHFPSSAQPRGGELETAIRQALGKPPEGQ
ncbi:glutathione peroxidase [Alcanivorax sp. MD8A]|uniref:Glutathione peroxidase n=1 Tax=Alcanivorax profundi TaxID=2338368 RepID=A0A418XWR1_9GAMM|nr:MULTISPECIES: glutathione peroxidase [Alcanivorax]MCG8392151.1 glutathione peroxidase [Pseudomonadales bacterium]PNE03799.1 glutathione peroxidase [Alcanivorax sp. MD8A]RJG17259.1 glutathione peroxidase [Alcanivorax profundi]